MTPGTPIRLGVAGLGRAFSLMLPTFLEDPRVRLVAACDPRDAARSQFVRDFQMPTYGDIEGLAKDPSVDAIYIASPHQFHAEQTRVAARHGKHILLEKPMALSLAECDSMIADCDLAGVNLIVGHCHSFDAPYLCARALVASGKFGRVRMINALNYTDFLYRPRRPEELRTSEGGGVVFSQAAHQVESVRLLAGSPVKRVRASTGAWDSARPTEGAYAAMLWFQDGSFASLTYSGYAHFDSDEWMGWIGEMGAEKNPKSYGSARRRLMSLQGSEQESSLKAAGTYGGSAYEAQPAKRARLHQHFGSIVVSCEHADIRPMPDGVWIYSDESREFSSLAQPTVPRFEVIDELHAALVDGVRPLHNGRWARATLEACLALLASARSGSDVDIDTPHDHT